MRVVRTLVVLIASLSWATGPAPACHFPESLRGATELTAAQLTLLAHGGSHMSKIAYSLDSPQACRAGRADIFPCSNVDLVSFIDLDGIGGGTGNDLWGWRDPVTGIDYALVGRSNGVAAVDVSDPENPRFIADLPTQDRASTWRDVKVYQNHAFVVADAAGQHGMQVFDLRELRNVAAPPVTLTPVVLYIGFRTAHNLAINETTGFAYAVGSDTCSGGLHMIDIRNPTRPDFAGCFGDDGYTHDTQCVRYTGPDGRYRGREICVAANEDTVTIVDVTDKADPVMLSRTGYAGSAYTHQGWLTEDQHYFIQDDELDERDFGHRTKTYVWDLSDLEAPVLAGFHLARGQSIDHNQYVRGDFTFQANYRRGLRILKIVDPANAELEEVAFFDTYPEGNGNSFDGAWSVYPYLDNGVVLVSDINRGLFLLRPNIDFQEIFRDGFESGDATAWSLQRGNLNVVAPGLNGTDHALEVPVDGTAARAFVLSRHPKRESTFEVEFLLNPRNVDLGDSEVDVLTLHRGGRAHVKVSLEQEGARYWAKLYARSDGGFELIGTARIPRSGTSRIGVEWKRASPGAADGSIRFTKGAAEVASMDGLANRRWTVTKAKLGLPNGSLGTAGSGSFLVDQYVSRP